MASYNKVILMGNLTKDPDMRYTQSGVAVCNFDLAVNTVSGSGESRKEEVLFIRINTWRQQAENCGQYLKKGSSILVDGRLKMSQWDGEDGSKRSRIEVEADRVNFMPKSAAVSSGDSSPKGSATVDISSIDDVTDDDIPF